MPTVEAEIRVSEPGQTIYKTYRRSLSRRHVPGPGSTIPDLQIGNATFCVSVEEASYPTYGNPHIRLGPIEGHRTNDEQVQNLFNAVKAPGSGWKTSS